MTTPRLSLLAAAAKPKLVRTLTNFSATGWVGPHTFCAMPGRMLVAGLSNTKDNGGVTGMALYNNAGRVIAKHAMPQGDVGGVAGDGYDIAINPAKNALLTSSFAQPV